MKNLDKEFKYNRKRDTKSKIYSKAHFPKRIWGVPNENKDKKGPKI
jgi:hypothetical protein